MFRHLFVVAALVLGLAACGPRMVTSDVTRFHALPTAQVAGQSFTIMPVGEQQGSLEFQTYAEMVAAQLEAQGMLPVAPGTGQADYVVTLDYGQGGQRTHISSQPFYGSAGYGFGSRSWYGLGATIPLGSDTRSTTYYTQYLEVSLNDGRVWQTGQRRALWQGRAVAETGVRELNPAMPYLTRALFEQFPGPSGQTVRVRIPTA
ncbi:DUF4136 domain-containing protein [Telmatospirillum sp. J64-1]|uniref:DUF4136 domain-containing protein n=1 Tax=Telmatospirillum sp. J64-1 TaxID=2502183 RepID=UPI00115E53A0|nr:DUF4136 domain-containing protein [Telmatospirillum sp. J64-1]